MYAVIAALVSSARSYGAKLYAGSEVLSIEKGDTKFILRTTNITSLAHPAAFRKVEGGISEEIHRDSVFQSLKIMPAFKRAAIYRNTAWKPQSGAEAEIYF